jgi:hypothetical protein
VKSRVGYLTAMMESQRDWNPDSYDVSGSDPVPQICWGWTHERSKRELNMKTHHIRWTSQPRVAALRIRRITTSVSQLLPAALQRFGSVESPLSAHAGTCQIRLERRSRKFQIIKLFCSSNAGTILRDCLGYIQDKNGIYRWTFPSLFDHRNQLWG